MSLWGRTAVAGVIFLITFIPVTSQVFVLWKWLSYDSYQRAILVLLPFNLAVLSIWVNYFLACTTDAGRVPKDYDPSLRQEKGSSGGGERAVAVQEMKKSSGKPRYCKTCKVFKPPRAHHCSECDRCVLKMDHHCPWLNNCVGFYNLGYFLRFVASVTVGVVYLLVLIGMRILDLMKYQDQYVRYHLPNPGFFYTPPATSTELLFMVLNVFLLFILFFTVGFLSIWQVYFASANTTTIENSENAKIDELVAKKVIPVGARYPYDLGMIDNLRAVLGSRIWLWLLPLKAEGDGLTFKVNPALLATGRPIVWPPPEYYEYREGDRRYNPREDGNIPTTTTGPAVAGPSQQKTSLRRHVRRGSEGYVVREWTNEERERMVEEAERKFQENPYHDSYSDEIDDEAVDSDDEPLATKRQRYHGTGLMADGYGRIPFDETVDMQKKTE